MKVCVTKVATTTLDQELVKICRGVFPSCLYKLMCCKLLLRLH